MEGELLLMLGWSPPPHTPHSTLIRYAGGERLPGRTSVGQYPKLRITLRADLV
jgi:hypothetical protein